MELGTILNTKHTFHGSAGFYPIMQNSLQHELQQQQQQQQQHPQQQQYSAAASIAAAAAAAGAPPYMNGRVKSENGSERGGSPHLSEALRYHSQQEGQYPSMPTYAHNVRYGSPTASLSGAAQMMNGYGGPSPPDHGMYGQRPLPDGSTGQQGQPGQNGGSVRMAPDNGPPKAYACSTCGKGFARRSDLARHGMSLIQHSINLC